MLRMTIEGVGFDHLRQTVVVLKDWEGEKLLPIWIGPAEARAIQIELEGARPARPLSHDLLLSIVSTVHGRVTRVVINDLQDATFYATIDIDTPKGTRHIDARPSDALAVAVRAKCPVFIDGGAIAALIDAEEVNGLPDLPEAEEGANNDGDDEEVTRFRRLLGEE
jgi:bifunctional DNase/RNase